MDKLKSIYASSYSATIAIIVVTVMTIATEFSVAFKDWLAGFTGHHWVTKSWVSIIVFVLVFVIMSITHKTADQPQTKRALIILQVMAVLGFVAILGFYLYEFFAH